MTQLIHDLIGVVEMVINYFVYIVVAFFSIGYAEPMTENVADTVKNVIREQPKLIYDALIRYRELEEQRMEREASKAIEDNFEQVFVSKQGALVSGNTASPKVIVAEFFDYNCGHCRAMIPIMHEVLGDNPDVMLVSRPLPMFGDGSYYASQMALAAKETDEGAYKKLIGAFASEKKLIDRKRVDEIAKQNSFDSTLMSKANSSEIKDWIGANLKLAETLKVAATPMFYVTAVDRTDAILVAPGFRTKADFSELINSVR